VNELVHAILGANRGYVTHSKISFKIPGAKSDWYPHQDNGYKDLVKEPIRTGLTMMILLEPGDGAERRAPDLSPRSHANGNRCPTISSRKRGGKPAGGRHHATRDGNLR